MKRESMSARARAKKPPKYGTPDPENAEWTRKDLRASRPAGKVFPVVFRDAKRTAMKGTKTKATKKR